LSVARSRGTASGSPTSGDAAHADWAPNLSWRWLPFAALGLHDLQGIHCARQRVFVVEQACAFLDADSYDEVAFHLLARYPGDREPVAYARALAPGARYAEASIGRVLTAASARGQGLGRELVRRAVAHVQRAWPGSPIRISAQSRLEVFYAGFGFVAQGEPYLDDGIPHLDMLLAAVEP
jgi:ElaA protein